MNIAIIGLGYVGLPLCLQFARSGVRVLGLDIDAKKVSALNAGRSYIRHIDAGEIKRLVRAGKFCASSDFSKIAGVGAKSKTISGTSLRRLLRGTDSGHSHLCSHAVEEEPRAGLVFRASDRAEHRTLFAAWATRRAGIHHLSRYHRE